MTPQQLAWFSEPWTRAEDRRLRRQFRAGVAVEQITLKGRTAKAIRKHCYRLGLLRRQRVVRRWSPEELALLRQLAKEQGLSANRIKALGHFPNRTLKAVATMKRHLGYVSAMRSDRARHARPLTGDELRRFQRFLRGPGRHTPTAEIVQRFGVSTSAVWRHRDRLNCRLTVERSRRLSQNRHRRRCAHRAATATLRERNAERRAVLVAALHQQAAEVLRNGVPRRTCQRCQQVWPLTDAFFVTFTSRCGGSYRCLQRTCRFCRNRLPARLLATSARV